MIYPADALPIGAFNALQLFPILALGYQDEAYALVDGSILDARAFLEHDYVHMLTQAQFSRHADFAKFGSEELSAEQNQGILQTIHDRIALQDSMLARARDNAGKLGKTNSAELSEDFDRVFFIITHECGLLSAVNDYDDITGGYGSQYFGEPSTFSEKELFPKFQEKLGEFQRANRSVAAAMHSNPSQSL